MAKRVYIGADDGARRAKKMYIGVDGKARRVKKGYIGDENGIARLFFSGVDVPALTIKYTGSFTDKLDVVMGGKTYRLLTLTSSGTLTIAEDEVSADVWMIGGGNGGRRGNQNGDGGGGGYSLFVENEILAKTAGTAVVIGAGGAGAYEDEDEDGEEYTVDAKIGGASSFGGYSTPVATATINGGSGGGAGGYSSSVGGTGDGLSKYPFEDTTYFTKPLGGGGGGGEYHCNNTSTERYYSGGAGGTNGGNGNGGTQATSSTDEPGDGGHHGGGAGGSASHLSASAGSDATDYGGGGGGGGIGKGAISGPSPGGGYVNRDTEDYGDGGSGYQGVVYVRIPYDQ